MPGRILNAPLAILAVLIALTLASFTLCESQILTSFSTLAIVSIAALKAHLVIQHYMEVRRAPKIWRFLYQTWNFTAAAIILVGHYMTMVAT